MKYAQPLHPNQRLLDSARNEERRALQENAYLRTALRLIAATIPFEVLSDASCRKMGTLFGQRVQIAQRALRGEELEPKPSMAPDSQERELAAGHYEEQQTELAK